MNKYQRVTLAILRIVAGWMFFYAGITKVLNPDWSAAGYLRSAKTFPEFYAGLASANMLPIINFINEWGLTLLGVALILGIGVRLSGILGAILMLLYYFPNLDFPHPNIQSYIVDQHIIYAAALLVLSAFHAGRYWGLEKWSLDLSFASKSKTLRKLLS